MRIYALVYATRFIYAYDICRVYAYIHTRAHKRIYTNDTSLGTQYVLHFCIHRHIGTHVDIKLKIIY